MMNFLAELRRRGVIHTLAGDVGAVWIVVQVMETTFPAFGFSEEYIRWTVIVAAIGLLPVLTLSWIFEWSPTGIATQKRADAAREETGNSQTADRIVIAILAVALLYFAIDRFGPSGTAATNTLAIMPFEYQPSDDEQAYLGPGVAGDILASLSKNIVLRVAPKTASFSLAREFTGLDTARKLGVNYVLEGSVRGSSRGFVLTTQLLSASDGLSIWGDVYQSSEDGLFRMVDSVSKAIEGALALDAPTSQSHYRPNPESYRLRLQAGYLLDNWAEEQHSKAAGLLRKAIEIDPQYPLAISNLISVILAQHNTGAIGVTQAYREAAQLTAQLLQVAPDSPEGYVARAQVAAIFEGKLDVATPAILRALELAPFDLDVVGEAATLCLYLGRLELSVLLNEYVARRTPVDVVSYSNLAYGYTYSDNLSAALIQLEKLGELDPEHWAINYRKGLVYLLQGNIDLAKASFDLETDEAYLLKGKAIVQFESGEIETALRTTEEFVENLASSGLLKLHIYIPS